MTFENLLKVMESIGFVEIRRAGSHVMMQHPNYIQRITIPLRSKSNIPPGTLNAILKIITEAGIIDKEEAEKKILEK